MAVMIASVHHTGTNLVHDEILKDFTAISARPGRIQLSPLGRQKMRVHCEERYVRRLEHWLGKCACVVPMRHPYRVACSWKARRKRLEMLAVQYRILKTVVDRIDTIYLPVDVPWRENWLRHLEQRLSVRIQTDWPVVSSLGKSATLTSEERQVVAEIMRDGFFNRFGYQLRELADVPHTEPENTAAASGHPAPA